MSIKLISINPSFSTKYKYIATFQHPSGNETTVRFGAKGYNDFISYHKQDPVVAEKKKNAYIARHSVRENWDDLISPGALSRWILWNKPTLSQSIKDFKEKLKGYKK